MIVEMKKITILISTSKVADALKDLRNKGMVHVEHINLPRSDSIDSLNLNISSLSSTINVLSSIPKPKQSSEDIIDPAKRSRHINEILEQRQNLTNLLQELKDKIVFQKMWGDYAVSDERELREGGVFLKLYKASKKELKQFKGKENFNTVNCDKQSLYIAYFTDNEDSILPFSLIKPFQESVSSLTRRLEKAQSEITEINEEMAENAMYLEQFQDAKNKFLKILEFNNVRYGMENEEGFSYLRGYCPKEEILTLSKVCGKNNWGILIEDVSGSDEVPTLLKGPIIEKMSHPIFKFMSAFPGYRENDVSAVFMIFFSIFFAMLIGDAGYGILFVIAAYIIGKKFSKIPKEALLLLYALSVCTIVWGALTGTWFGFEKIGQLPILRSLVIGKLDSFVDGNQTFIMALCFTIGAVHLTIAHLINAVKIINSAKALGQFGWISIIWGLYYLAGNLVLEKPFPSFAMWFIISGVLLVIVFSSFNKKNILKGSVMSFAGLPLSMISAFSDVVSYVRLFAVGYASVMVAKSFNEMALSFGFGSFLSGLIFALIIFAGHSLNIVLGVMAVVVHGIRLNMLEFSSHAGMQWSGKEYKPFSN